MYQDKTLICRDCQKEFVFSAGEQEFYAEKGFDKGPVRCYECRKTRKLVHRPKMVYEIVCAACGKVDKITFEPRHDRAVLCNECYNKNRK